MYYLLIFELLLTAFTVNRRWRCYNFLAYPGKSSTLLPVCLDNIGQLICSQLNIACTLTKHGLDILDIFAEGQYSGYPLSCSFTHWVLIGEFSVMYKKKSENVILTDVFRLHFSLVGAKRQRSITANGGTGKGCFFTYSSPSAAVCALPSLGYT